MNKKEIAEIRKQFKTEKSTISRMCCCYVNHEKEKVMEQSGRFLTLPEEELFKYFEIFRQTLGGTLGKNLLNLGFPLEEEAPGGAGHYLLQLRDSKLEDEQLVSEFFDRIIANYTYAENYLILLIYGDYDVPGKASDGLEMFDASDTVYSHILVSICPVTLTKPGLSYYPDANELRTRIRDWVVEKPMNGFLFPSFTDRTANIHETLYFCAKPEEPQADFIQMILGNALPMSAGGQRDTFRDLASDAMGETCDFETAVTLQQNLNEMLEAAKENPEPLELTRTDVETLFTTSGIPDENMADFARNFEAMAGEHAVFAANNIAEPKKFRVESPGVKISVDPTYIDLLETRVIDGRPCLVIPVDSHIEVNGVTVRTTLETVLPSTLEEAVEEPSDL